MKIYVSYDFDNHEQIRGVQTEKFYTDKGKAQEEIDEALAKSNEAAGFERFRCIEVSEEMANILRFTLGECEYRNYRDITDIYEKLRDIQNDLDSIQDDCFHVSEYLDTTLKEVEALVPEEDK